ncbi:MAG: hypothetical protein EA402_11805 [Planctomycetota bacterium]|nr:MAG: hypothetical protein EA402_11805 [Planctomycetota bacterium]
MVLGITSNLKFSKVPGNVLITAQESGLDKASVIVVSQLVALDKEWFLHRIGPIPQLTIDLVEHGLGLLLGFK